MWGCPKRDVPKAIARWVGVMIMLRAAIVASIACTAAAQAAECPRAGTLDTSRVLAVDAAHTPRVGLKSFPQTLPLADDVAGAGDTGKGMRACDVLPDWNAHIRTSGPGAAYRRRGPHRRPSHLV